MLICQIFRVKEPYVANREMYWRSGHFLTKNGIILIDFMSE